MSRQPTFRKLYTGNKEIDRLQDHLREMLNPVLANPLIGASDFRFQEIAGAVGVAPTFALQYRTPGTQSWVGVGSFTSAGVYTPDPDTGGGARRPPVDANDYLIYTCDESALPLVNTGTAGSAGNMDTQNVAGGNVRFARTGMFSGSLLTGAGAVAKSGVRASGSSALEPATPVSIELWLRSWVTPVGAECFCKAYRPTGSWTAPFNSISISCNSGSPFSPQFSVTVSGTQHTIIADATDTVFISFPFAYIVGTYDGTTQNLYVNGNLAATAAQSGAIDYGTHGPWILGVSPDNASTQQMDFDEARVRTAILSPSTIATRWRNAIGWT